MKVILFLSLALPLASNAVTTTTGIFCDTSKKNRLVAIFAPGAMPSAAPMVTAPAFSPNGRDVYFGSRDTGQDTHIMQSHYDGKRWSLPSMATFSGDQLDLEPAFSPDGSYLIFASSRPGFAGGTKLDGHFNGKVYPGRGGNLWKVKRVQGQWGTPGILPPVINAGSSVFSPAVAGDGSLYFMRPDTSGKFHIYRSQLKNNSYGVPIKSSFCLDRYGDYDPAVAPDESFLIYSSARPPALPGTSDLFIVFKTSNGWSEPADLRIAVSEKVFGVEARLSPDLKTLYFSNNVNDQGVAAPDRQYIWQVDISYLLRSHSIKDIK